MCIMRGIKTHTLDSYNTAFDDSEYTGKFDISYIKEGAGKIVFESYGVGVQNLFRSSIFLNNRFYCKEFLEKWVEYVRRLLPVKLLQICNSDTLFGTIRDRIIKLKVKIKTKYRFIYPIQGDSELRVYNTLDKYRITITDRDSKSEMCFFNPDMVRYAEDYESLVSMAYAYLRYRKVISQCNKLLDYLDKI